MNSFQRTFGHWLCAVGERLQRTEVESLICFAQKNEIDKGRRSREKLDFVSFNCLQNAIWIAVLHGHNTACIGQRIKHGIDAADVVVEQKGHHSEAVSADMELFQQPDEIMHSSLAFAG